MNLNVKNLTIIEILGHDIILTETIVNTWIVMAVLIIFAVIARIALERFEDIPKGFQSIIESIVEIFDNFATTTMGKKLHHLNGWFFTIFIFTLASALSSIFGLRSPTADWATTFAMALSSFVIMIYAGIRHQRGRYLKSFIEPNIVFSPMNLIGELAKPVSLSFRLFGNMLSGTIILTLYYSLTPYFAQIGLPALLTLYFDIIMGALQTYIFVIISMMYAQVAAN